jgi:hypothetical protein
MIKDNYGKFRNVANALVKDELAFTYSMLRKKLRDVT